MRPAAASPLRPPPGPTPVPRTCRECQQLSTWRRLSRPMKRSLGPAAPWKNAESHPRALEPLQTPYLPSARRCLMRKKGAIPPTRSRWETHQRKVSFHLPVTRRLISEVHLHVRGQHERERTRRLPERFPAPVEPGVGGADWSLERGRRRFLLLEFCCSIIYLCLNSACGIRRWKKKERRGEESLILQADHREMGPTQV